MVQGKGQTLVLQGRGFSDLFVLSMTCDSIVL